MTFCQSPLSASPCQKYREGEEGKKGAEQGGRFWVERRETDDCVKSKQQPVTSEGRLKSVRGRKEVAPAEKPTLNLTGRKICKLHQ